MPCLPVVNKHFRVLRFVTQGASESTMIFVCVSENDATQIGDEIAAVTQTRAQRVDCFLSLWTRVDDCQRIFGDQVDVDWTDIERCRQRYGNDAQSVLSAACF